MCAHLIGQQRSELSFHLLENLLQLCLVGIFLDRPADDQARLVGIGWLWDDVEVNMINNL